MRKIKFGTDGIRGRANSGAITPDNLTLIGMAAGSYIHNPNKTRQLAVIGKDTRLSGYLIEPALTSGLISTGIDVLLVGPMPTPAISMLTKSLRADIGIMISASHNPYYDNGMKFFGSDGFKLKKEQEEKIEELIRHSPDGINFATSKKLGRARRLDDAPGRYIEFAKNTFPKHLTLSGIKLVVDSANGAAYHLASKIFWELGAEVISIGDKPDGTNINLECGSMHPEKAVEAVLNHKADLGIVLDGDADRIILVDEKGNLVDGDEILALIAKYLHEKKQLNSETVVCTSMSNYGFELYCKGNNIKVVRTDVGDKYVSEALKEGDFTIGGEQSGHIIMSEHSATGDGIISALKMLEIFVQRPEKNFSEICHPFVKIPQKIHNVRIAKSASKILNSSSVKTAIEFAQKQISDQGRINVRASGTEPLIRVMVEHNDQRFIDTITGKIEEAIISCGKND